MPVLNTSNPFQSWILTPQEEILGSQLSLLQKQHIQNLMAASAHERINLVVDVNNMLVTVQRDAELKGQILAYQYLIDLSNAADEEVKSGRILTNEGVSS